MTFSKKEIDTMTVSDVYELIIEMRREERFNQSDEYECMEEEYITNSWGGKLDDYIWW